MEIFSKKAINAINSSNGELKYILRLSPNNRFVTRQYARFCKELLADYDSYADMIEKSYLLHRNINVNKDQTHEYGLKAYQMLPEKIIAVNQAIPNTTSNTELSSSAVDIEDNKNGTQEHDGSIVFSDRIKNLRIPSTYGMLIISLLLYFVLLSLPSIIIIMIIPSYVNDLLVPLNHVYSISMARTLMYQIIGFSLQTFMELKGTYDTVLPVNFGSTYKSYLRLSYLCKKMTIIMQKLNEFRSYNKNNANMKEAKAQIFDATLNYSFFSNTRGIIKTISTISAFADVLTE